MRRRGRFGAVLGLVALALLAGGAGRARASVILYNTFGPGDSFNTAGGLSVSGSGSSYAATANGFTPAQTATLDQVRVAAKLFDGTGGIDVLLASDDGTGKPDGTIEPLGTFTPTGTASIFALNSTTHPLLTAGTPYWVILQPDPADSNLEAVWNDSSPFVFGPKGQRHSPAGAWSTGTSNLQSAFEVLGTPAATAAAVPEPSTFALLALGGAGLAGWRRWRKRGPVAG
jgi:hypothetical protein